MKRRQFLQNTTNSLVLPVIGTGFLGTACAPDRTKTNMAKSDNLELLKKVIGSLERSHGTGIPGDEGEQEQRQDSEDSFSGSPPPEIFGEEIDTDPPCCVVNLIARPRAPNANETYARGSRTFMISFSRDMQMQVEMKNAVDAAKVEVIQYWKDEQYMIGVGTPNAQQIQINRHTAPDPNPGWQWVPGADGWTVDSVDTDRCWPIVTVTGNIAHWGDRVSIDPAIILLICIQNTRKQRCACKKDRDELMAFFDFPAQHWQSIRTSNPIESTFGTIRHRTK